jgi:pectate lyase
VQKRLIVSPIVDRETNIAEVGSPLYSTTGGVAVATGNDFGGASNTAPEGSLTTVPYEYELLDTSEVEATVEAEAGATLTLE